MICLAVLTFPIHFVYSPGAEQCCPACVLKGTGTGHNVGVPLHPHRERGCWRGALQEEEVPLLLRGGAAHA